MPRKALAHKTRSNTFRIRAGVATTKRGQNKSTPNSVGNFSVLGGGGGIDTNGLSLSSNNFSAFESFWGNSIFVYSETLFQQIFDTIMLICCVHGIFKILSK